MKRVSQAQLKLIQDAGGRVTREPSVDVKMDDKMAAFFSEFTTLIKEIREPEIVEKIVEVEKLVPVEKVVEKIIEKPVEKIVDRIVEKEIDRAPRSIDIDRDVDGLISKVYVTERGKETAYMFVRNEWGLALSIESPERTLMIIRDEANQIIGVR